MTPSLRTSAVGLVTIDFNEAVSRVDISHFSLTRDGVPVSLSAIRPQQMTAAQYTLDLTTLNAVAGVYQLTLNSTGGVITDTAGNAFAANATTTWTVDNVAPTATISTVTPVIRNTVVGVITIGFNENVTGLTASDFSLTQDGSVVDLSTVNLTPINAQQYSLDLSGVSTTDGAYRLTLNLGESSVRDTAGNTAVGTVSRSWLLDSTAPTSDIVDVTPETRMTDAGIVSFTFSEPVQNFDVTDLVLTRDTGTGPIAVDLTGLTVTATDFVVDDFATDFTIDLTSVTNAIGGYSLSLIAAGSAIQDTAGNALLQNVNDSWERIATTQPDLTAASLVLSNTQLRLGQTTATFTVQNAGDGLAASFATHFVWSPNDIPGDADDVIIVGSQAVFSGLVNGETVSRSMNLQLDRALLYAHANSTTPAGDPVGTVANDVSHLFLMIDTDNTVAESNEANNSGQGAVDGARVTYFPWDNDGNGTVTPSDALAAIRSINTRTEAFDFDGNGIVTPLEALSVLQRLGYTQAPIAPLSHLAANAPISSFVETGDLLVAAAGNQAVLQPAAAPVSASSIAPPEGDEDDLFAAESSPIEQRLVQPEDAKHLNAVDQEFVDADDWLSIV